ncbi:MAG: MFS transporter [Candidatus Eisenbacteria bacterium]|uniref:MFS transporter n=1 Tax=Eiseniibacteriota bacterium TaxID=2212470 RepID=A0A538SF40_UNCEI|nr:MAG: MFS transporter [Candidatus Eisenbacteria bacterium]
MAAGVSRGLLRQRNFAALWWGQLISILGERLTYLALVGLLAEHTQHFRDTGSSWLLSALANVMLAPVLLLAPFTGAWVDRWNLRRVLIASDALRAGVVLSIPILYAWTHGVAPVFAQVFVLFTCNVFFLPAKSAITPEIVPPSQLLAANALLSVAGIVSTAVGALLGGWVIDHWGWGLALEINAVTYVASVAALALISYRPTEHPPADGPEGWRGYLREVGEGWRVLKGSPRVGLGLTALAAVWMGGGFLHVAGNQHIQRAASVPGMERLGVLLCALGLGAGLSTWWINTRGRAAPRPAVLGIGLVLAAGALAAFAASTRFAVFVASSFLVGAFVAPAFVLSETLLQEGAEPRQRGRVFSARDFLMRLLFLLTATVAAWLTRGFGTRVALLASACIVAVAGALAMAWGMLDPALMREKGRA